MVLSPAQSSVLCMNTCSGTAIVELTLTVAACSDKVAL